MFYIKVERDELKDGYNFINYKKEDGKIFVMSKHFVHTKEFLKEGKDLKNLNSVCGIFKVEDE